MKPLRWIKSWDGESLMLAVILGALFGLGFWVPGSVAIFMFTP